MTFTRRQRQALDEWITRDTARQSRAGLLHNRRIGLKTEKVKTMKKKKDIEIEQCVERIAQLKKEFGADVVYKASRRYYDRTYNEYEWE